MNETTSGTPLTATVGERLGDDPHVREVRDQVAHESGGGQQHGEREPARARTAPSRRARSGGTARAGAPARPARPFPWGALALAAVGWALLTGMGGGIRRRARALGRDALGLAQRLQHR